MDSPLEGADSNPRSPRRGGADEEGTHERLKAHLGQLADPKIKEHRGDGLRSATSGQSRSWPRADPYAPIVMVSSKADSRAVRSMCIGGGRLCGRDLAQ
jgi:hypothetical protein